MKSALKIILLLLLPAFSNAQMRRLDSLKLALNNEVNDTLRMAIYREIYFYYNETNRDSALYLAEQHLLLAQKLKLKLWEAAGLNSKGYILMSLGNYPRSLQSLLQGMEIAKNPESEKNHWQFLKYEEPRKIRLSRLANLHHELGHLYRNTGNTGKGLLQYLETRRIAEEIKDLPTLREASMNLGLTYLLLNKLDSALAFELKALDLSIETGNNKYHGTILLNLGNIYYKKGNKVLAKQYFLNALQTSKQQNNLATAGRAALELARLFKDEGRKDSSLYYAKKGVETYESLGSPGGIANAFTTLSSVYKLTRNIDSAFKYLALAMATKDSMHEAENLRQFQNMDFEEQLRLQELEQDKINFRNKIRTYALLAGISGLMLLAIIFFRNYRQKQKAKEKIEKAYKDLEATQAQLIQSEKMASLGELTAGIAHEIQNPLNFVNNFSEVNKELLIEMNDEMSKGNYEEAATIAKNVIDNQEKINQHGKRADAIVKGMLQHSRISSGQKELTDINSLADEYLRLAYHGLRAKDKTFNAKFETNLDPAVGKINIVPQEIGRVILNLINNAFYAVSAKALATADSDYQPAVSISTRKSTNKPDNYRVEITVRDNGNGIPQKLMDKIFQPFFTTKPAGQGTGLGLSLSYDIIRAHGGELKVETEEGKFSEFIIILPP